MTDWLGDENDELAVDQRWPLAPTHLLPRVRWLWWEQLWSDVCALRVRYRLGVRSRWWEDQVQVGALAALAAWVERYDSGEWASSLCFMTWSGWRRSCGMAASRFAPTATGWRSHAS